MRRMGWMDRRRFLSNGLVAGGVMAAGAAVAGSTLLGAANGPGAGLGAEAPTDAGAESGSGRLGSFEYLFLTDTHLEPELAAADGCAMAFRRAAGLRADFAIQGGDHVFDALAVDRKRADALFDLYEHTEQALGLKVHHAIGNHDHFGVFAKSGVGADAPGYGKRMFEERVGPTYSSFDHEGYHFVILDSIEVTADRSWEARVSAAQLAWLTADLEKLVKGTPVLVTTHVPLVTAFAAYAAPAGAGGSGVTPVSAHPQMQVANAYEVLPILEKHNVLAVFQGHTHINEVVRFRGIPYVTSGAVCGNWWHGTRMGIPEGFTVVSLREGKVEWRYETYGWKSVAPENT